MHFRTLPPEQSPSTASQAGPSRLPVHAHAQFLAILADAGVTPTQVEFIDRAYDFAKRAHSEASREGGGRYFEHCRSVALILIQEAGVRDPNVIAAALLHDSVEDTSIFGSVAVHGPIGVRKVAHKRIADFFNTDVADTVLAVTKVHRTGDHELDAQNKISYFENLMNAGLGAILVKMADRLHNLRSLESRPIKKQRAQYEETSGKLIPVFEAALVRFQPEVAAVSRLLTLLKAENELLGQRVSLA